MNRVFVFGSLLALTTVGTAQRKDRIHLTDGKSVSGVRVTDFTWREVKFKTRAGDEARSSDRVAALEVATVRDKLKRGYGASGVAEKYQQFLGIKEQLVKEKDLFTAQFAYHELAKLQIANADWNEVFAILDELQTNCPESGFLPFAFRTKLDYYLGKGKAGAKSATTLAKKYSSTATTNVWPGGFAKEAEYYTILADAASGASDAAKMSRSLEALLRQTEGSFPSVANRVKLSLADAVANSDGAKAKKLYDELTQTGGVDEGTRAGALVGRGLIAFNAGNPANTEPYREAMMSFLRAYIIANAPADRRAQALFYAAQSCEKWRGQDHQLMARRLRGYLRRDFGDTAWAKRK